MWWVTGLLASVIFVPVTAQADVQVKQDWRWDLSDKNYAYASTENKDQRTLGQYCYYGTGSCLYAISLGVTCSKGSEFSAILNSNVGSARVRLVCGHRMEDENAFYIRPFSEVDGIVKEGSTIAFAVPMKSGEFKIVQFSLAGSAVAIDRMRLGAKVKIGGDDRESYKAEDYL